MQFAAAVEGIVFDGKDVLSDSDSGKCGESAEGVGTDALQIIAFPNNLCEMFSVGVPRGVLIICIGPAVRAVVGSGTRSGERDFFDTVAFSENVV